MYVFTYTYLHILDYRRVTPEGWSQVICPLPYPPPPSEEGTLFMY